MRVIKLALLALALLFLVSGIAANFKKPEPQSTVPTTSFDYTIREFKDISGATGTTRVKVNIVVDEPRLISEFDAEDLAKGLCRGKFKRWDLRFIRLFYPNPDGTISNAYITFELQGSECSTKDKLVNLSGLYNTVAHDELLKLPKDHQVRKLFGI